MVKGILNVVFEDETAKKLEDVLNEHHQKREAAKSQKAVENEKKATEREALKEQKRELRRERINTFKESFKDFKIGNYFQTQEEDDGYVYFTSKDDKEQYQARPIDITAICDVEKKVFEKPLSGQDLLRRNLSATPLFIRDEENYLNITNILRVYPYENDEDKAYILLETKYEYFVLEYKVTHRF